MGFQFSSQELNLGSLDESQESQPLVHQGLEARSKFPQALASLKKCISEGGKICKVKKTKKQKKQCKVYYQRHSTSGRAKEKGFAYIRWKQGRDARLGRNAVGGPPHEEGYCKETGKSVAYSSSSGSLFNFGQLSVFWVPPPTSDLPQDLPQHACTNFYFKIDFSPEDDGGALASHIMGCRPLLFDPQGAFLHICLPCPKDGKYVTS